MPILRGLYGDHMPIYSFIIIKLNANENLTVNSVQFSRSVVSYSLRPMDRSKPGLRVHHQLPEFTQTHVHWRPLEFVVYGPWGKNGFLIGKI